MKQKTNWMLCLSIGIGISLLTIISCGDKKIFIEYNYVVDHIYVNLTGHNLTMEVYNEFGDKFKSFNIENGDSVNTHTSSGDGLGIFFFDSDTHEVGDSVVVRFNNNKCLLYLRDLRNGLINEKEYDNYSEELIKPGGFTLYYTFTEEDYNLAVDCE